MRDHWSPSGPTGVSVPGLSGAYGADQVSLEATACRQCGSTPAVRRALSDGSGFTAATCFQCPWEAAESARSRIEEKSVLPYGEDTAAVGPGASDAEINAEWARTDAVNAIESALFVVGQAISSGCETIDMTWTGGPLDEKQTEAHITLGQIRL